MKAETISMMKKTYLVAQPKTKVRIQQSGGQRGGQADGPPDAHAGNGPEDDRQRTKKRACPVQVGQVIPCFRCDGRSW